MISHEFINELKDVCTKYGADPETVEVYEEADGQFILTASFYTYEIDQVEFSDEAELIEVLEAIV